MNEPTDLLDQSEWLLHQVVALQQALDQFSHRLESWREELRQRSGREASPPPQPAAPPVESSPPEPGSRERRSLPRRPGNPTAVRIAEPPFEGWVIDRSPGGFSLLGDVEIPAGTRLNVSPTDQLGSPRWFAVEVRNCRRVGKNWVLGCQFADRLTWRDLRLFG